MKKNIVIVALLALSATACTTRPVTLYQWDAYQPQVYEFLKGKDQGKQIDELEKGQQVILSKGGKLPPGYRAHLGMLYANAGNDEQAVKYLEAEKQAFPESADYVDFLLKKQKKQ
jgi:hypothetical protein